MTAASPFDDQEAGNTGSRKPPEKLEVVQTSPPSEKVVESCRIQDDNSVQLGTSNPLPRPPISYASPRSFVESVFRRFLSLWTRSFAISIACGQFLSICATSASVFTTELVGRGWILPNTQVFFAYSACFWVFTPYTIYRYGFRGWGNLLLRKGWKYFLLGLCDVEASFLYVKAFGYTDLLSCMLLDAWTIPVCLFLCRVFMGTRYHWTQILGVLVSVAGLGMLVASDFLTGKDGHAQRRAEGDGYMIAAAIYGLVRPSEHADVTLDVIRHEVVGQMGMWGMIVSGIQAAIIERQGIAAAPWDGKTGTPIPESGSPVASFVFTVQPYLFRVASSAYFNISLLTSDFYGLIFGERAFPKHYSPYWLYFPAFVVVVGGLVIYFWHATPEEQGPSDVHTPRFVRAIQGGSGKADGEV
ncbi:DUF914-domain-containing protein [Melanogaster broomeanus]|nr:DUF914-domain-containing protein [Melanogaster broomeanus]